MNRPRAAGRSEPRPLLVVGNGIVGGMESHVLTLARGLRERGITPLVAAPFAGDFTSRLLADGHPAQDLCVVRMLDALDLHALDALSLQLRSRRLNIVHSHLLSADILAAATAHLCGLPAVSTLHGLVRCREELLLHRLYGLRFVAVSEAGRRGAIGQGSPATAVTVIENGIDTYWFDPALHDRGAARRGLGLTDEALVVLSVSRLSPEKNPGELVDLAAALDLPGLVWLVAGTGPLQPALENAAAAGRAAGRIRFLGARDDVASLLAAADLLVLTSRSESLPLCVLEAMAMAVPVVAYDVGGLGEAICDGAEGFLVPSGRPEELAERMRQLLSVASLRQTMGQRGRRAAVIKFAHERMVDRVLRHYTSLLEEVPGQALAAGAAPALATAARSWVARPTVASTRTAVPTSERPVLQPRARRTAKAEHSVVEAIDAHLHLAGDESPAQVLETVLQAGLVAACLISPFLDCTTWQPRSATELAVSNQRLLELVATAPGCLYGWIHVDPRAPQAAREVELLAAHPQVCGLKLLPTGWRPDGPEAAKVYEVCAALELPILFHSGVAIGGRHSDSCRPALFEAVRDFPGLRIILAHLGWPWVDEAIAVAYMDLLKGRPPQILLDTSPGTPAIYRRGALEKALAVIGCQPLVWGSDRFVSWAGAEVGPQLRADLDDLSEAGADPAGLQTIFSGNLRALLPLGCGLPS